ncbi:MAG: serine hydrolase domain-containing protein [Saprospiraceae bacterium]
MKSPILLISFLFITSLFTNAQNTSCVNDVKLNPNFSKAAAVKAVLQRYTTNALPGAAVAVYSESEGWWAHASGYAKVENRTPMQLCHLQYLQSVAKTYMAVTILQLQEQGKIKFDEFITRYLPAKYAQYVPNANRITVRMLLNQTSGVPEYNVHPKLVSHILEYPLKPFSLEFALQNIENEPPLFEPGAQHKYTNTNYLLLALIADAITGDHAAFMQKNIFNPLELHHTFYRNDKNYLKYDMLVNSYWDVAQISNPANVTQMQRVNVASMIGDDGIVCTPTDAVKFLKGLMEGKLLKPESMQQMLTWVNNSAGNPTYGMGIYHFQLGDLVAYGHGGGGLGAGCLLVYLPQHKMYVFIATNVGVVVDNPLAKKADEMKNEVLMALLM